MLAAKHFPNEYWGEAVATAVYIMNRCPTKSVKNKVPQEAWTGMNHSVSHLKVFGCVAYAHIPDELRRKLDKKGQKCIFVGYSEDTKAYKLYDPRHKESDSQSGCSICRERIMGWKCRHKCQDCVERQQ